MYVLKNACNMYACVHVHLHACMYECTHLSPDSADPHDDPCETMFGGRGCVNIFFGSILKDAFGVQGGCTGNACL